MCGGTGPPMHASSALRSRLLNAWRSSTSSPSTTPNSPRTSTSPPSARASGRISSAARSQMARRSTSVSVSCAGPRELQEVGHHLAERLGLGADPFDIRTVRLGQRRQIEQLAVALNRRQAVPELVRDAGRQLPHRRQAVLQPQLLFEILHRRQIGEEADRAVQLPVLVRERRDADAEMRDAVPALEILAQHDRTADDRRPAPQAFVDHFEQRPLALGRADTPRRSATRARARIRRPAGLRIRIAPFSPTTSSPDVRLEMISPLSRSDASARAAVARSCALSFDHRLLQRRREQRRLHAVAAPAAPRVARRRQRNAAPRTRRRRRGRRRCAVRQQAASNRQA